MAFLVGNNLPFVPSYSVNEAAEAKSVQGDCLCQCFASVDRHRSWRGSVWLGQWEQAYKESAQTAYLKSDSSIDFKFLVNAQLQHVTSASMCNEAASAV